MIEGIRDFLSFYKLLEIALDQKQIPIYQRSAALNWYGYYLGNGAKDLFLGIYLDKPQYLTLNTEDISLKKEFRSGNAQVSVGELYANGQGWKVSLELSGNEIFMEDVLSFIGDKVAYARNIVENLTF